MPDLQPMTMHCKGCGKWTPVKHLKRLKPGGHADYCEECRRAWRREHVYDKEDDQ